MLGIVCITTGSAFFTGTIGEVKVIQNKGIKYLGIQFTYLLQQTHHSLIIVAEYIEKTLFGTLVLRISGSDTAFGTDTIAFKYLLAQSQLIFRSKYAVTIGLQIHLVQAHVLLKKVNILLQFFFGGFHYTIRNKIYN